MALMTARKISLTEGFGKVLKLARIACGLTQLELSRKSGVSTSLITKIENGRIQNPRAEIRLVLAKALNQPRELFLSSEKINEQEEKTRLAAMLSRCGVDEKIATMIVNSIRTRSRGKIISEMREEDIKEINDG